MGLSPRSYRLRRYCQAHIDKAASLGAHEASMCRVLGHACLHARENDAALAYYRRQAEVEPKSNETWSQIAEVALKLGNMKLAALASEAAQRLDPADPLIQITLGNVASAEGRLRRGASREDAKIEAGALRSLG